MKKVLVSLFAITLTLGVFAQDSTSQTTNTASQTTNTAPRHNMQNHDGVIMRDGKLQMMKNGQTTQLTSDLTLDNGTVVMADGTVKMKDGTTTTLKNGDYVTMDGTVGNVAKWQKDHPRMMKDSSMSGKMKSDSLK